MMDTDEHFLFPLDTSTRPSDVEAVTGTLVEMRRSPTVRREEAYEQTYVEPVRRLRATLSDVLDTESHPERAPEEALSILKDAMDTFNEESAHWL